MSSPTYGLGSFGLSTTPIADIKSELQQEIERNQLTLLYAKGVK